MRRGRGGSGGGGGFGCSVRGRHDGEGHIRHMCNSWLYDIRMSGHWMCGPSGRYGGEGGYGCSVVPHVQVWHIRYMCDTGRYGSRQSGY